MRWFINIMYLGSRYEGWQTQPHARTLQDVVTTALCTLCREDIVLVGSGRTDTGVHAIGQVAHFDTKKPLFPHFLSAINAILPADIAITNCRAVKQKAHARYTAIHRVYRYCIHTKKNPFLQQKSYYLPLHGHTIARKIAVDAMNQAIQYILGWRRFSAFAKNPLGSTHCCLHYARWYVVGDALYFDIIANRFLRGMVRSVGGALLSLGRRKRTLGDFLDLFSGEQLNGGGGKLPAEGLYLVKVSYPRAVFLHEQPYAAWE